jgi:hypothetical protein
MLEIFVERGEGSAEGRGQAADPLSAVRALLHPRCLLGLPTVGGARRPLRASCRKARDGQHRSDFAAHAHLVEAGERSAKLKPCSIFPVFKTTEFCGEGD